MEETKQASVEEILYKGRLRGDDDFNPNLTCGEIRKLVREYSQSKDREIEELKEMLRQIDKSLYIGKDLDDHEILKWYIDVACVIKEDIQEKLNSDMQSNGASQEKSNSKEEADTIKKLKQVLEDCEDYFESRADADHNGEGLVPNKEMKLLSEIRKCLKPN